MSGGWFEISARHLIVGPEIAGPLARGLRLLIEEQRRNGHRAPAEWQECVEAFDRVATEPGPVLVLPQEEANVTPIEEIGASWLGTPTVASRIGRSRRRVGQLIRADTFPSARFVGGRWLVHEHDVAAYERHGT